MRKYLLSAPSTAIVPLADRDGVDTLFRAGFAQISTSTVRIVI
jgi:hypothetical protein